MIKLAFQLLLVFSHIFTSCDGNYYTGSTKNLYRRLTQHQAGEGANHTKKRLPVILVYVEVYSRIDHAFYREKQIQKWRREKKEALLMISSSNPHPCG